MKNRRTEPGIYPVRLNYGKLGWKVVRVWEHELRSPLKIVAKLKKQLQK